MKPTKKAQKKAKVSTPVKVKKKVAKTAVSAKKSKAVVENKKSSKTVKGKLTVKQPTKTDKPKAKKTPTALKTKATSGAKGLANNKRKSQTLNAKEYDAFVVKAAKKEKVSPEELVTVDRRERKASDTSSEAVFSMAKPQEELQSKQERRPKIQRRRQIDPTTCERDYTAEEIEFMNALNEYKRHSGRMFPTCSEILEVFCSLGYTKRSHEESVEVCADLESGDVYVTTTETETLNRLTEFSSKSFESDQNNGQNDMPADEEIEEADLGFPFLMGANDSSDTGFSSPVPCNAMPYFA